MVTTAPNVKCNKITTVFRFRCLEQHVGKLQSNEKNSSTKIIIPTLISTYIGHEVIVRSFRIGESQTAHYAVKNVRLQQRMWVIEPIS
jgi:hypothetical protein